MVSALTNGRAGSWGARALPRRNRHCCCAILPAHKRYVMVPNKSNGGGQGQLSSRRLCPARRGPGSTLNYPACLPPLPLHLPGPSLHLGRMQLTKFETSGSLLLNARPSFWCILLLSYCGPACCAPACVCRPPPCSILLAAFVCFARHVFFGHPAAATLLDRPTVLPDMLLRSCACCSQRALCRLFVLTRPASIRPASSHLFSASTS